MNDQILEQRCEHVRRYTEGKHPYTYECAITPCIYPCYNPEDYQNCDIYKEWKHIQETTDWDKVKREREERRKKLKEVIANFNKRIGKG